MKYKFCILLILLSTGCTKKFRFTTKVCDHIYVESYYVAFGQIDRYLTDSISFNYFLGTLDDEHESIKCQCIKDSISIEQLKQNELGDYHGYRKQTHKIDDLIRHVTKPRSY